MRRVVSHVTRHNMPLCTLPRLDLGDEVCGQVSLAEAKRVAADLNRKDQKYKGPYGPYKAVRGECPESGPNE